MLASLFRKAQFLSLDVVLGAVILLRFFSNLQAISPPISTYFLLAGVVWWIYTMDHLRDARLGRTLSRGRYRFHIANATTLRVLLMLLPALFLLCLFLVPSTILIPGFVLAAVSGGYLAIHKLLARSGLKELYVSIVYSLGILLVPFTMGEVRWSSFWLLFLATFINLILFSWYEKEEDLSDGFSSIATVLDRFQLEAVLLTVISISLASLFLLDFSLLTMYFSFVFAAYGFLFVHTNWASKKGRYRTIGDGIFLLPVLFEWL